MESTSSELYSLTSLQIGDVQSYLSQAYLYFASTSNKFLILVDNQSWRVSNHSRSTHIRELLITKCRTSPFRNTKALLRSLSSLESDDDKGGNIWKNVLYTIRAKRWKKAAIFKMMDLRNALHGFIVFEVLWKDVRGINYLNELQADTSMAFEVRSMRKWEFNSISQASSCIKSWFSATPSETNALQACLSRLSHDVPSHSPRAIASNAIDRILEKDCQENEIEPAKCDTWCQHHHQDGKNAQVEIDSMKYEHTLIKFCFKDRDLPFEFKAIITSDLRLLTLVESGLPFWVIFLQSYPLFCRFYRPWMRPLVRTLYMLVSLVTVVIGFYDLYKNVPLLRATASHICGPLFVWIEEWDVISRIGYLGTMLVLQNLERAVRWLVGTFRSVKILVLMMTRRLFEPFEVFVMLVSPIWGVLREIGSDTVDLASMILMPVFASIGDLFELLFLPFELLFSFVVTMCAVFKPVCGAMWELCVIPAQACVGTAKCVASMATEVYELVEEVILLVAGNAMELTQFLKTAKTGSSHVSMWNTLWRDLLSKVFRSLRSVINGVVKFLNSCNRHRLSIYNHLRAYMLRLSYPLQTGIRGRTSEPSQMVEGEDDQVGSEDRDETSCKKCGGVQKQ